LHKRRTDPDIRIGDFVLAQRDLAQVVKVNTNPDYGFKSFRVRYLIREPLPGLSEDEFVGEHIRLIYKRSTSLVDQTIAEIKRITPELTPSVDEINAIICEGVVLEWNNGLEEASLGKPGGLEKLKAFRGRMEKELTGRSGERLVQKS
jgi:hypothetical protein